jgi:ATP-dependent DNA helicase DinG
MPIVFSSATLSVEGSFDYVADSLGIDKYLSFSVESPYDYETQMKALAPEWLNAVSFEEKMRIAVQLLQRSEGRALLLFPSKEELLQFKQEIVKVKECSWMRFLYEGDREISRLISDFQQDEQSVLCAVSLWEGLDVPGPSLSNVIVWSLPYPPRDPVFMSKRKDTSSPFEEVDLPYMLLRLRQGMGRLIRSREDSGMVAILSEELRDGHPVRKHIEAVLPKGVKLEGI